VAFPSHSGCPQEAPDISEAAVGLVGSPRPRQEIRDKRTRRDDVGRKVQRAEVRFDGVAGCLRTPAGGSSRQTVLFLRGKTYRSRLMTIRETARLMGLPESFVLPVRYNEGYHVTGDGVVVPVVRYLAENLLEPVLAAYWATRRAAA
jgi:DNA (cytosine-5)-methyltransferase 1